MKACLSCKELFSPNFTYNKYNQTVTETALIIEKYQESTIGLIIYIVLSSLMYVFFPVQNLNTSASRSTSTPTPPLIRGMPPHLASPHSARLISPYNIASAAALSNSPIAAGFGVCLFVSCVLVCLCLLCFGVCLFVSCVLVCVFVSCVLVCVSLSPVFWCASLSPVFWCVSLSPVFCCVSLSLPCFDVCLLVS